MLIAVVSSASIDRATAQTLTTLHRFTAASDGANPYAGLVLSGNILYGTTRSGGISGDYGNGTVFKINTDGTSYTKLYTFKAGTGSFPHITNTDRGYPYARLVLSGDTLYGTTTTGGSAGNGTIFAVKTNGTGFTNLHTFSEFFGYINSDGANPYAGLILSNNTLYGTAQNGGSLGSGTIFKVNTDGSGFTVLHTFTARSGPYYTNSDGAYPSAGLTLSGDTLYGTAGGGYAGNGAVFRVNTDGTGFTNLSGSNVTYPSSGSLVLSGSILYGTSGAGNSGTIFRVSTNGTDFTNLYWFTATFNPYYTNRDGQSPNGLILANDTIYGTTSAGGIEGAGTLFRVNTNGSSFTNLHNFAYADGHFAYADGCSPFAGLTLSNNTLYGTTEGCGISPGYGTVFSFSVVSTNRPPGLTIIPFGSGVILTWPTNAPGFTLQSTTNLAPPVVWTNVSPAPIVINGSNTVLNPISGTGQFFRLRGS